MEKWKVYAILCHRLYGTESSRAESSCRPYHHNLSNRLRPAESGPAVLLEGRVAEFQTVPARRVLGLYTRLPGKCNVPGLSESTFTPSLPTTLY